MAWAKLTSFVTGAVAGSVVVVGTSTTCTMEVTGHAVNWNFLSYHTATAASCNGGVQFLQHGKKLLPSFTGFGQKVRGWNS